MNEILIFKGNFSLFLIKYYTICLKLLKQKIETSVCFYMLRVILKMPLASNSYWASENHKTVNKLAVSCIPHDGENSFPAGIQDRWMPSWFKIKLEAGLVVYREKQHMAVMPGSSLTKLHAWTLKATYFVRTESNKMRWKWVGKLESYKENQVAYARKRFWE